MSPIDKISDIRRYPRLGMIRLGVKKEGQRGPYPQAVDYFVCPEEVQAVFGERPTELKVMFPADDLELVAPQWYKCYSYSQGLICKGNGKTCRRKVDIKTGDFANKETKQWVMTDGICEPDACPMLASKQCRKMMSLFFILPDVPGLGVYQLNTSSFYSIVNMNSQLAVDGFLRPFTRGRIAFIPLILSIGPQEVNPPGEGRKTVHILKVRADVKLADIIRISRQRPTQVLLPTLDEEEPPEDLYPPEIIGEAELIQEEEVPPEQPGGGEAGDVAPSPPKTAKPKTRAARPARPAVPAAAVEEKSTAELEKEIFGEPEEGVVGPAEPGVEGMAIDIEWLNETLRLIRWSEDTAESWIASKWPGVDTSGKLVDVLGRLTREQAEVFINEIRERAEKHQPRMFE